MVIYIYILFRAIVIMCEGYGCHPVSMAHFNYILGAGLIELFYEMAFVVRLYKPVEKKDEES